MLKKIFFAAIFIAVSISATKLVAKQINPDVQVLKIEIVNTDREVLHISINNKTEGSIGKTTIFNSKGETVYTEESELAQFPSYFTIDISKFQSGIYTIKVVTESKHSYQTTFEKK